MLGITIEGVSKRYPGAEELAVDNVDLEIEDGEFVVLLGPSGCGKTTTLRCLAGLERPNTGRITIGDRVVWDAAAGVEVPTNRRDIGMIFQLYGLWPHMTVRKNIAYPLKARRMKEQISEGWVEHAARLVGCESLLDRLPSQLSGGQQQRVAVARGIAARPHLVLFDEPLSNLDARLRDQVRAELHKLQREQGFTAVFVTHDQAEALALATKLVVMRAGAIEQVGPPEEVFFNPATEYVADFIGMTNSISLDAYRESMWWHEATPVRGLAEDDLPAGCSIKLRPEDLAVTPVGEEINPGQVALAAVVVDAAFGGTEFDVALAISGSELRAKVPYDGTVSVDHILAPGTEVQVSFARMAARYFTSDGVSLNTGSGTSRLSDTAVISA